MAFQTFLVMLFGHTHSWFLHSTPDFPCSFFYTSSYIMTSAYLCSHWLPFKKLTVLHRQVIVFLFLPFTLFWFVHFSPPHSRISLTSFLCSLHCYVSFYHLFSCSCMYYPQAYPIAEHHYSFWPLLLPFLTSHFYYWCFSHRTFSCWLPEDGWSKHLQNAVIS